MHLFILVSIVAVGTAGLSALIVLADVDLVVMNALRRLDGFSGRVREPLIVASEPAATTEPAEPPTISGEVNDEERWLAAMASYTGIRLVREEA